MPIQNGPLATAQRYKIVCIIRLHIQLHTTGSLISEKRFLPEESSDESTYKEKGVRWCI